jgi:exonuclease SbcC
MSNRTLTVKLTNFRRFAQTDKIIFEPGITLISGPNGVGKSTLIEAIIYALYGPKQKKGVKDICTDNVVDGEVQVETECIIDGQDVRIVRTDNKASLWINGALQVQDITNSQSQVNKQIGNLLGNLTREQFESTYVAMQGNTSGLVEKGNNEVRDTIGKLLQLGVLTKALEIQDKRRSGAKTSVKNQGERLNNQLRLKQETRVLITTFQDARKLEKQVQHIQKYLKDIEQTLDVQEQQLEMVHQDLLAKQSSVDDWEEKRSVQKTGIDHAEQAHQRNVELQASYQSLREELARLQGKLTAIEGEQQSYVARIQRAQQCQEAHDQYQQAQEEQDRCTQRLGRLPHIKSCYDSFMQAQKKLNEYTSKLVELATVEVELQAVERESAQAKEQWDTLRNNDPTKIDLQHWQERAADLKSEMEQTEKALQVLQNAREDARCPTCMQPFREHTPEHRIQHLKTWLREVYPERRNQLAQEEGVLNQRKKQWWEDQQEAEKQYEKYRNATYELQRKVDQKKTFQQLHTDALDQLEQRQRNWEELHEAIPDSLEERSLKANQQALSHKIKQLKEQADLYAQLPHFQDQLTHKQQEYQQLYKTIEEHQKNLAAIGYDPDLFQQTQKNLQEAHRQAQQIQSSLDQALKLFHETQLNEQSLRRDGELAKQEYVRFQEAFTEYQHEERLLVLMDDFKKHFFAANTQEVAQRTAELLRDAVTDQSILGIQFDPKGLFYRDGSSIVRPVQRLSGGEKALVGLCLRLALAEQAQIISRIGKVKFLILDEVLASLDEERCEAVQRIFQNVLQRGIFEQIIMVTHLESVKQSWQAHGLTIEKADSTTSKITTNASQHTYYEVLEEMGV